ncbi:hypothetical protein [Pyxidicoccus fallax]|uniref:hypothetical protein n=1 Tax=Pyxidicoccus fallax TaxID=394095 RepID=UPI001B7D52B9|nr:hypothetical protein [Pyxidicoccus fallax]
MKLLTRSVVGVAVALGFGVGVWFASSQGPTQVRLEAEPVPAPPAPARRTEVPRVNETLMAQAEAAELRRKNKALEEELQALRSGASGPPAAASTTAPSTPAPTFRASAPGAGPDQPLPFAPDTPEPYTPKGFERVSQRAAKECGMGLDVVALDCSEFPCIAWTRATDPNVKHFSMSGCGPWEEAFKHGTVVVGSIEDADGGGQLRYFSWMAVPPDPNDLLIAVRRAKERNAGMKEALGLK